MLTFKEFREILYEVDVKFIPIKGKPKKITMKDWEKIAGGGKAIIKKAGFVISTDNAGNKWYVPKPVKKGMNVVYDNDKGKFMYSYNRQLARMRSKMAKRIAKTAKKKRARTLKRTLALRGKKRKK